MVILRIALFLLYLLLAHPWSPQARAQRCWGTSSYAAVAANAAGYPLDRANVADGWYTADAYGKGWQVRYVAGRLFEAKDAGGNAYELDGKEWRAKPELAPPPKHFGKIVIPDGAHLIEQQGAADVIDCGVQREKLGQYGESYWFGTQRVDVNQIGADVIDDSKLPCLTVVAADASKRKEALAALTPLRDKVRLQVYDPADKNQSWALAPFQLDRDLQFAKTQFVVLLQLPPAEDGRAKVIGQWHDPAKIPQTVVEANRKVDPTYDPNKNNPSPVSNEALLPVGIVAAGIGGLILFSRKAGG